MGKSSSDKSMSSSDHERSPKKGRDNRDDSSRSKRDRGRSAKDDLDEFRVMFKSMQQDCKAMQSCIGNVATDVNSVVSQVRDLQTNVANLTNTTTERFTALEGSFGETQEKLEDINVRLSKVEDGGDKSSPNTGSASSGLFPPTAPTAAPMFVDDFTRPGDPAVLRINVHQRNKVTLASLQKQVDDLVKECGWATNIYKLEGSKIDNFFKVRFDGTGDVPEGRVKCVLSKLKLDGEWRKLFALGAGGEQHQIFFNKEVSKKSSKIAGATRRCAQMFKQKYPGMADEVSFIPSMGRILFQKADACKVDATRDEVVLKWTKGFCNRNNVDKEGFNSCYYAVENIQFSS
jgi:hypothetical protein